MDGRYIDVREPARSMSVFRIQRRHTGFDERDLARSRPCLSLIQPFSTNLPSINVDGGLYMCGVVSKKGLRDGSKSAVRWTPRHAMQALV